MTGYELRVIPGCPNTGPAAELFREALTAEGIAADRLTIRVVASEDDATALAFHGSPTFTAGGGDLFPAPSAPALSCRVYLTSHGLAGLPDPAALRAALAAT
ncbi:hypothetical protein [Paenarthrobacter sp. 22069]|uniref:hypothetical protein n=1 Tax=Paenarthrobacter sp. 22069 TaxID=3453864 RepID=UPI003F86C0E0